MLRAKGLKDNRDEIRRILICRLAQVPRAGAECRDPCVGMAMLLSFMGHQDANLLSIPCSAGLCTPAAHFPVAPNANPCPVSRLGRHGSHAHSLHMPHPFPSTRLSQDSLKEQGGPGERWGEPVSAAAPCQLVCSVALSLMNLSGKTFISAESPHLALSL